MSVAIVVVGVGSFVDVVFFVRRCRFIHCSLSLRDVVASIVDDCCV